MAKLGNKQVCKVSHTRELTWYKHTRNYSCLTHYFCKSHPYSASFKNYMIPLEIPTLLGNVVIVFEYMLW